MSSLLTGVLASIVAMVGFAMFAGPRVQRTMANGDATSWMFLYRETSRVQALDVSLEIINLSTEPSHIACVVQVFGHDGTLAQEEVIETPNEVEPVRPGTFKPKTDMDVVIEIDDPRAGELGAPDDGALIEVKSCRAITS